MFFKIESGYVNSRGQMSVDLLIAVAIMVLSITMASYYIISAFVPYSSRDIDLQASAYRVAMILSEDGGLWVTGKQLLESDWAKKVEQYYAANYNQTIREDLARIGLANTSTTYLTKLSYEVQIPCYLNETKVILFFNRSLWRWVFGKDWRDRLADLIGLNSTVRHYRYNITLCYMNGTPVSSGIGRLTIGYPIYVYKNGKKEIIPQEFGKFERIVVIDNNDTVNAYRYNPNSPPVNTGDYLLRLVVYVW